MPRLLVDYPAGERVSEGPHPDPSVAVSLGY